MRLPACLPPGTTGLRVALCAAALIALATPAPAGDPAGAGAGDAVGKVPRAPDEGGPRRWTVAAGRALDLHAAPSTGAEVVTSVPAGATLANLGCTETGDRVWCEVAALPDGPRGYAAAEHLAPARAANGTVPVGPDDSARRARRGDFDARATIPCAQVQGQAMGACSAGVARAGGGDATVVVTFPNGFARRLSFVEGRFWKADATMSGNGTDTDWRIEGGRYIIRVDDQRYEVPEALILGG